MKNPKLLIALFALLFGGRIAVAQVRKGIHLKDAGWFSLGVRASYSAFNSDGNGLGTGGQFRIQMSSRVNTDWFLDYITINISDKVRSEYIHFGWSVLFYPIETRRDDQHWKPYILAGHCFDYNKKTAINDSYNFSERWGSAVQAGLGTHYRMGDRCDLSLTCQYMMHLTPEIETTISSDALQITRASDRSLEGHLLTTLSVNYKLIHVW